MYASITKKCPAGDFFVEKPDPDPKKTPDSAPKNKPDTEKNGPNFILFNFLIIVVKRLNTFRNSYFFLFFL